MHGHINAGPQGINRIYMIDLGSAGFATFASNIVESVHPNDAGAAQIATLLYPLVKDLLIMEQHI